MTFKPSKYYKDIYSIDYNKLKEEGITTLIFDLDNTLGLISNRECPRKTKLLIKKLKEDFLVLVCSNNNRTRLKPYLEDLGIGGVSWSMKPLTRGLRKIKRNYHLKKKEMAIIGDQVVTDIFMGNRLNMNTILVDPLGEKDLKITAFNRWLEKRIMKRIKIKRGDYYEKIL